VIGRELVNRKKNRKEEIGKRKEELELKAQG